MTELIALLTTGKGTWGHVAHLLENPLWTKVFLLTNELGLEKFRATEKVELIYINENIGIKELRDDIKQKLQQKIKGSEIGVNFISGSGKEHMALVSALLQLGIAIRFVAITRDGMEEI